MHPQTMSQSTIEHFGSDSIWLQPQRNPKPCQWPTHFERLNVFEHQGSDLELVRGGCRRYIKCIERAGEHGVVTDCGGELDQAALA